MKRRSFIIGTGAGLAGAPVLGPVSALATNEDDGPAIEFERVKLLLEGTAATVLLLYFIVIIGSNVYGWNMRRAWRQFPLNRAGFASGALQSSLFRPTVDQRVAKMKPAGQLFLFERMLILIASGALTSPPKSAAIVHRGKEFVQTQDAAVMRFVAKREALERREHETLMHARYDDETGELIAIIPPEFR